MDCEICGSNTVRIIYDNQSLCMDCYNVMMAAELEIDLPKLNNTFAADDALGIRRIFEVERLIMATAISLTAREQCENGYEFAVDGALDADQHELLAQLMEKTKEGLSETYLEQGVFVTGEPFTRVKDYCLKGVLTYDPSNSEGPLVIIDGKPYTWVEVGRLLQSFEGFQVKIEMKELAEKL